MVFQGSGWWPLRRCTGLATLAALIASCAIVGNAAAEEFKWQFAGWYGGGCYPNVEFDPVRQGRVFLASDVAGLWRSDDNGEHWSFVTNGLNSLLVTQIRISGKNPDIAYVGTGAGVSVSFDAGTHWTALNNLEGKISFRRPQSYRSIWLDDADDQLLCVGTSGGDVFCSSNRGQDWNDLGIPKTEGNASAIVAIDRLNDKSGLLAAGANGISVYNYAARSWTPITPSLTGISDVIPYRDGFLAVSNGEIWRSDKQANQWLKLPGAQPGSVYRLEQDPASGRIYAARNNGWSSEVLYSANELSSWQRLPNNSIPDKAADPTRAWAATDSPVTALKASPFVAGLLFRTDWWGVWRSSDGGQTWQERIAGAPNTVGTDIVLRNSNAVFASAMDNGLLMSADGGASFTPLFPTNTYRDDENGHVWRVINPSSKRIIATSSPWNQPLNQVLLSEDGGKTFQKIRAGLPAKRPVVNTLWDQGYPRVLAADPRNENKFYLGIDGDDGGGLFISSDGARTWVPAPGQPPSRKIYSAFAVDPVKSGYLYWGAVGDNGGIYRSTDDGQSWAPVFQESRAIFEMATSPDGTLYATGALNGGAVFASRDHGDSWSVLVEFPNTEAVKAVAVSSADPNILVTSTVSWAGMAPQKLYASNDGGSTWADITGDLPAGAGAAAFAFSRDGSVLYMSRYAGGIYKFNTDQLRGVK